MGSGRGNNKRVKISSNIKRIKLIDGNEFYQLFGGEKPLFYYKEFRKFTEGKEDISIYNYYLSNKEHLSLNNKNLYEEYSYILTQIMHDLLEEEIIVSSQLENNLTIKDINLNDFKLELTQGLGNDDKKILRLINIKADRQIAFIEFTGNIFLSATINHMRSSENNPVRFIEKILEKAALNK